MAAISQSAATRDPIAPAATSSEPSAGLRVETAAIRIGEAVFTLPRPNRHHNVMWWLHVLGITSGQMHDQGFVLSNGRYVDRESAAHFAKVSGQVERLISPPRLYSEDLWAGGAELPSMDDLKRMTAYVSQNVGDKCPLASAGAGPSAAPPSPLGWQDIRLCAGEGKLSPQSILSAANILWGRRFDALAARAAEDMVSRAHKAGVMVTRARAQSTLRTPQVEEASPGSQLKTHSQSGKETSHGG